jgi:hypothetical protein
MYTIIIGLIIGFIIGIIWVYDLHKEKLGLNWLYPIIIFVFLGTGALFGTIVANYVIPLDTEEKQYVYSLQMLKTESLTSGRFFLGTGEINGNMNYIFYLKIKDYYSLQKVDAMKAIIKYAEKPRLIIINQERTNNIINKFSIKETRHLQRYIFEIPEGSIINSYNLH